MADKERKLKTREQHVLKNDPIKFCFNRIDKAAFLMKDKAAVYTLESLEFKGGHWDWHQGQFNLSNQVLYAVNHYKETWGG